MARPSPAGPVVLLVTVPTLVLAVFGVSVSNESLAEGLAHGLVFGVAFAVVHFVLDHVLDRAD